MSHVNTWILIILLGAIGFAISRNSYRIAAAKGFDEQLAFILTAVGLLCYLLPGLLVNLIYRFVKPRNKWSWPQK